MPVTEPTIYTPPMLAARYGCKVELIHAKIRAGLLRAMDLSEGRRRPRYKILPEWVREFEEAMTVKPAVKQERRRKARKRERVFFR